jgi:hypothetical protein
MTDLSRIISRFSPPEDLLWFELIGELPKSPSRRAYVCDRMDALVREGHEKELSAVEQVIAKAGRVEKRKVA